MKRLEGYTVERATIECAEIAEHYVKYLNIRFNFDGMSQGYPACKVPNLEEVVDYFLETMNVNELKEAVGKEVYIVGTNCDIMLFVNPENNRFFSLQAKVFPNNYKDDIFAIAQDKEYIKELNEHDALIAAVVSSMNEKKNPSLVQYVKKIADTYYLAHTLDKDLNKDKTTKKAHKI